MAKGWIRSTVGGLALVAATGAFYEANTYETMSPNDIANRRITDAQRAEAATIQQALTQKSGPVYKEVVATCDKEESDYRRASLTTIGGVAIQEAFGKPKVFNKEACINNELSEKASYAFMTPEKGEATEAYKKHLIFTLKNSTYLAGGIGAAFLAFGIAAMVRGRKSTPDAVDSNTPNTPSLG